MISIDWGNKIIHIPRIDMTLTQSIPTEIRSLNLNLFRLELKNLEDSSDGMAFERTHNHNTTVDVGGVILARVVEILNGYTITFENGLYAVNLVGANSNVSDVVNVNQVSVRSSNSAGLIEVSGDGVDNEEIANAVWEHQTAVDLISVVNQINTITDAQSDMILEIYRLYGLDPTRPLIVTNASRTAGAEIVQSISTNTNNTTITRT